MCAVLSLLFVLRFVRETKGRELEDMGTGVDPTASEDRSVAGARRRAGQLT